MRGRYYFFILIIISLGIIFFRPLKSEAANWIVPEVKIFKDQQQVTSFFGFLPAFRGGTRVATGDVDGDGIQEIIVGAGPGGGPNIQIYKADGSKLKSFMAYDIRFRNGVKVATGDVDGDGQAEIITGPGPHGGPNVKVFEADGSQLISFMAYDVRFRGGINVACGDINNDGRDEIITGAGTGGRSHVRVFDQYGNYLGFDLWPFDPGFRGGVTVTAGQMTGDETEEIVTAVYRYGRAHIKVYKTDFKKTLLADFIAFPEAFRGGLNIDTADLDNDGLAEIVVGAAMGGGPHVRAFEFWGEPLDISFFPYPEDFRGGVYVAAGNVDSDPGVEIITGPGYLPEGAYRGFQRYIEIDISEQKLSYYENGFKLGEYPVSSGKAGMDTPLGIYKVLSKADLAYSRRYALYMPWWMQFTSFGHGIHGLPYWRLRSGGIIKEGKNHLGIPVSHGCVRLPWNGADKLYEWATIGTPIIIHA